MTVYTDQRFLDAAVESILNQEFRDLELVIVDDGTGQDEVFRALARRDPRIRLFSNPTNLGTAAAANRGIEAARGDIILRLDADDIAEPTHVGRLVAALDDDPELGLVGSSVTLIDEADRVVGVARMPETDLEIRWTILFHNPFYHSAVAYRRSCFEAAGRYRIDELVSQDHYLWFDMLPLCRARNIAEPLTRYRLNTLGLTATNASNPRNRTHPIREALWPRLGLTYDLYDDAFALDLTHFIRGLEIAAERRAPAYRKLLTVLRTFLARSQPFARDEDAEAAQKLAHGIVARTLANRPARLSETLSICWLCWLLDRRAAAQAAMMQMASMLKTGWQVTRRCLTGSWSNQPRGPGHAFLSAHASQYGEFHRDGQIIIQKTEPLKYKSPATFSQHAPAPLENAVQKLAAGETSVEFVLIVEAGILEDQALLLCESIRCFAGAYSRCPITVVSPRSGRRPSPSTIRRLEQLQVEYLPIEIESCCPQYGTSYKVHSLAYVERRPGPPIVIQVDSDTVFIAEPDFSLGTSSAAARPVDVKGMCTTGPGDAFDSYWRELCTLVGVDYEHLPIVQTTVGGQAVRASYNGGLIAAQRACGLFQRTEDIFKRLVASGMMSWGADGPSFSTGTGVLSGEATAYWGTSQAAFSLAAVAGNHSVRVLPVTHNFPLHSTDPLSVPNPSRLVHIHYHGLFTAGSVDANPILDGTLELPAGIPEWLRARLPLNENPPPEVAEGDASRQPRRKAILILGMHRSGTSALSGAVKALGAAGPKNPIPGDHANPKGYWESIPLNRSNEDFLASAASSWHDWLQLDPRWLQSQAVEQHRHRIKAILESEFGGEPLFFVKDPRICRFVPLASSILGEMNVDTVALLPIRNPLEVARSLNRRNGLPLPTSFLLWLRHVLDAEYHSRDMPRHFLRYEKFLIDCRHHMDQAAEKTGIVWPSLAAQPEIELFLSTDLHHERASTEDMRNHPDVTPLISTSYDILCAMADDGDSRHLRDQLDVVRTKFDESCSVLAKAVAADKLGAEKLRDEIVARIAERDALLRERDALQIDREGLLADREALLASSSWRITAPLRWIRNPRVRQR